LLAKCILMLSSIHKLSHLSALNLIFTIALDENCFESDAVLFIAFTKFRGKSLSVVIFHQYIKIRFL